MAEKIKKTDAEWRSELTPAQYQVLRQKGTERAFSGELAHTKQPGQYVCAGCGKVLFRSDEKFESGSGWPSFWAPVEDDAVQAGNGTIGLELCEELDAFDTVVVPWGGGGLTTGIASAAKRILRN